MEPPIPATAIPLRFRIPFRYALILLSASAIAGCLFDGGKRESPFIGEWKDRDPYMFRMQDSLIRVDLHRYADSLGYYVPLEVPIGQRPDPMKNPLPDSLFLEFTGQWKCTRTDCDSVLWIQRQYRIITADSIKTYKLLDGSLESLETVKFRYTRDSIYYEFPALNFELAVYYRFYADGDSLQLWEDPGAFHFGRSRDALPAP